MRRRNLLHGIAFWRCGCRPERVQPVAGWDPEGPGSLSGELPVLGKAPEISSTTWINSEPITLAGLKGTSAVGIAFWTYG